MSIYKKKTAAASVMGHGAQGRPHGGVGRNWVLPALALAASTPELVEVHFFTNPRWEDHSADR